MPPESSREAPLRKKATNEWVVEPAEQGATKSRRVERPEETKNEPEEEEEGGGAPSGRNIRHLRVVANNTEDTQLGGKLGSTRPPDKLPKG